MRDAPVRFALVSLLALGVTVLAAPLAGAQVAEDLDPAADFRTAPMVRDGTYRVELVSGERVWVSVLYTNDVEVAISAHLTDADVLATDELTLYRAIIGPNLEVFRSTADDILVEDGLSMRWLGGQTDTNLWFLSFTLETTGQVGVRHTLELTLVGFAGVGGNEPCGDDCTLDEELAEIENQIAEMEAQLEACEACLDPIALEAERDQLADDIAREEAAILDLCGGEICDSLPAESSTPRMLVVALGATAAATGGGAIRRLARQKAFSR